MIDHFNKYHMEDTTLESGIQNHHKLLHPMPLVIEVGLDGSGIVDNF
ncbi:hypothetical protein Pan54_21070 [Rubinisphaera italica]|uniref:Uncharacterized protein n=1 Tax=Rubinisphaera italica TaxID=2527969 RepID=A0A5C5XG47_9PLAN|nr:hypothetical protein Pan54_21070 [Rubinisphaera italica]